MFNGFFVRLDTSQSIAGDGSAYTVTLNHVEEDVGGFTGTLLTDNKVVVPADGAGVYLISAGLGWSGNPTDTEVTVIMERGITSTAVLDQVASCPAAGVGSTVMGSRIIRLAAGDKLYLQAMQNSGGALNALANASQVFLAGAFLGP